MNATTAKPQARSRTKAIGLLAVRGLLLGACLIMMTLITIGPDETYADTTDLEELAAPLPGSYRILAPAGPIRFPFDLYRGDIRFQCEVNGKKVHMLLDDGYMWDQLLFWGSPRVDSLGLAYDGTINIGGGSDDTDGLVSKTASGIRVGFPGVEFTEQTAIVTPQSSGNSTMWAGSVGQISAMFFKHFVVDINFDDMMITLIRPDEFEYQGRGVAVPWEPLGFGPFCIPATLTLADGREIVLELFMDIGYNDQLQIWTGKDNNIAVPDKALPAGLGMNIQRVETTGYVGRLPRIDIGGFKISDLLVAYVAPEHSQDARAEAMIGLGLLSRFNLVFDYHNRKIFFEPTRRFEEPFEYDMSGLSTRRRDGGFREIVRVYDSSPADEAGLQVGDRITHINGRQSADVESFELLALMKQAGKTVTLKVVRDDREWEVSLVLRRLI